MRRHFTVTGFVSGQGRTALHWHKFGMWLPAGGHVEPDEDPVQAMLREVREETGLDGEVVGTPSPFAYGAPAQLPAPVTIGVYDIEQGDGQLAEPHQHIDLIYFTRPLAPDPPLPAEMRWRWFTADDLRDAADIADDVKELGLAAIEAARVASAARG
ncbi:MAG: NUDIX domain-containing protein [Dehalococcoidia bacterium]